MANRKRKIVLRVPVTQEERELIEQKMVLLHTKNFSAYARKMLIDGYIEMCIRDSTNIEIFRCFINGKAKFIFYLNFNFACH